MSDVLEKKVLPPRRQRSIRRVHYDIKRREEMARPLVWPAEVQAYMRQVAGHTDTKDDKDTRYLGLLQSEGKVLKPIIKESQRREVEFYNRISTATEEDLVELRQCVPKYFGCTKHTYQGHTQDYIILEDLTVKMLEPCIMDVKIGKITWDPLASEEKKMKEQSKYALCKQQYGFCIPGYQVYRTDTGRLCRYNKDYGKKLHGDAVKEAIRSFLNVRAGVGACRVLTAALLAALWRVQRWARRNARLRLRAASLLLAYDAADLRACCQHDSRGVPCRPVSFGLRRRSVGAVPTGASCALTASRRLTTVPTTPTSLAAHALTPPPPPATPWTKALDHLAHNHSFDHNYEHNLSKMKMDYRALLERLSSDTPPSQPWATVKLIDFAHAFFDDEETTVDDNFREGIDNFVDIIEELLRETDDFAV